MTHHPQHQMHRHSLQAYADNEPAFHGRKLQVYKHLLSRRPGGATDRQVMQSLGYTDMNAVRPRITELIQEHWAYESTSIVHQGRTVRYVVARTAEERARFLTAKQQELQLT